VTILTAGVGTGLLLVALLTPALPAAGRLAARLAAAVRTLGGGPGDTTLMPPGTSPAVGALFHITGHTTRHTTGHITGHTTSPVGRPQQGRPQLGSHFCTASVVDSPSGDLVMTAAHCVSGLPAGQIAFVPGYRDGAKPFGVWTVTSVIVDQAWLATASPDDDVAFLVVRRAGTAASVQSFTGGERLGIGQPAGQRVQVTGYPETARAPVTCLNRANWFSPAQLQFDCDGFTDGTSGSALLARVSPVTGLGTAIGVIGGYQQGGDTAAVSYADRLGPQVGALYKTATRLQARPRLR
jgi:V8-like Glu-specific endopeptidase